MSAKGNPSPSPSLSRSAISRLSRSTVGKATGRVTRWVGGSVTVQAAGKFLRRQLWAWPVIAAVVIGAAGWLTSRSVERAMLERRAAELTTILNADVEALRIWMAEQAVDAELIAADEQLPKLAEELLALAAQRVEGQDVATERALIQAPAQITLRKRLEARLKRCGYVGYFLVSPEGVVVAADQDSPIGKALRGYRQEFFHSVLTDKSSVSHPYRSPLLLMDEKGELQAHLPTMFTASSLRDANGKTIASLGMRIRPQDQFTKILGIASSGQTGETYAFNRDGLLLSRSRFDEELKEIGLVVDRPDASSILAIDLRNPGADLMAGERRRGRRADQPLTEGVAAAIEGESGYNVNGYRDYRGTPVIGAWTWLPEYDFGVISEIDVAEAFQPLYILRRAFWSLMGLLLLSAVAIFVAMLFMAKQQRLLQKAVLDAKQLGQYRLEEKLGSGGMGTVYKARHAMLRRPTAVKLLDIDKMSDAATARFEREVQLTSALTHPNTVGIFDYGRTPEGIFYYAMEYLEGQNLDDLVQRHGPLDETRAVQILRQVCGSLAEAHGLGLVHRDIKPANIFLTTRGGIHDFVKVLDFGLVKDVGGADEANLTGANVVTGTPLYLAPEAISEPEHIDARADVYGIGAVAYFLLTGTPVFSGASVVEICMKHTQAEPESPTARLGRPISAPLEALVLRCLAKSRSDRPADAAALLKVLNDSFTGVCSVYGPSDAAAPAAIASKSANGPRSTRSAETATFEQTMEFDGSSAKD